MLSWEILSNLAVDLPELCVGPSVDEGFARAAAVRVGAYVQLPQTGVPAHLLPAEGTVGH